MRTLDFTDSSTQLKPTALSYITCVTSSSAVKCCLLTPHAERAAPRKAMHPQSRWESRAGVMSRAERGAGRQSVAQAVIVAPGQ